MEILSSDRLNFWREEGQLIIQQNFKEFHSLVTQAQDYVERGEYTMGAVYAEIAAAYACGKHPGLFTSWELEQLLIKIGQQAIPANTNRISRFSPPKKILHVSTYVASIGGHSRMIWRWINQDKERSHSIVLTRQVHKLPKLLSDAVRNSQGKIHYLNKNINSSSIISSAKELRKIAEKADLVVLHIYSQDVIPMIAFTNQQESPPIIYINLGDHLFWLGMGISNVIANLSEASMRLSQERRGVEEKRNLLLPIILEPSQRLLSRSEAKQQIGIPQDCVLIVSIARSVKYRTIDGIIFADTHIPLLKKYKQAILLIVGADNTEDWSSAIQQTDGRIRVVKATENTAIFYQAADIYIDSFPISSNTSLLEAGSYGIPLVTRFPYSSVCDILGGDAPGLKGNLIRVQDIDMYTSVLSSLVEDEDYRLSLGEATKNKIAATHWGNNCQNFLNNIYYAAANTPRPTMNSDLTDEMFTGEPDVFLPKIYGTDHAIDKLIAPYIKFMPFPEKFRYLLTILQKHNSHNSPLTILIPEWIKYYYYSLRSPLE